MTSPSAWRPPTAAVPPWPRLAVVVVTALALAKLALHIAVNATTPYGVHRDEYLYLAMGEHLRLWRMDFPPLIALAAIMERSLFGDSLVALRLVPAVAGALLVLLAALTARELGGGRFAQGLAGLLVIANGLFLRAANLFQPVVLDQLWWTLGLYALAGLGRMHGELGLRDEGERRQRHRAVPDARWWMLLGLACGLGLLTKLSIAFFVVPATIAILATRLRRSLLSPWPWLALLLAAAIGAPSIVGQIQLGWPVLGQMADLRASQLERVTYLDFLVGQLEMHGPGVAVAAAGLAALLAARRFRAFRAVGIAAAGAFLLLMLSRGKPYYAGPIFPALFAAGAATLELVRHRVGGAVLRWATVAAALAFLAVGLPIGVPILPPERLEAYTNRLGLTSSNETNVGEVERIPQDFADMLGWPEQVAAVARVHDSLPAEQRARAVVLATSYGRAGAIDFHGPRLGLPKAVAPVGSYWFFGPGPRPGDPTIVVGSDSATLAARFRTVTLAARVGHPFAVREERDVPIWVCEGPVETLQQLWPSRRAKN